jgi:hypothetical protein
LGVGSNDRGVQHHPFKIRLGRHRLEDPIKHAYLDPAPEG